MNHSDLQAELQRLDTYHMAIDGDWGAGSRKALLEALALANPVGATAQDIARTATKLNVDPATIMAVRAIEASGSGFSGSHLKVRNEAHHFGRLTAHKWTATHPRISSRSWNAALAPKTQPQAREYVADMAALDVDAAFLACSWGAYQIMGFNHHLCGWGTAWHFVQHLSTGEAAQLEALALFLRNSGLVKPLRARDWAAFARGYNGPSYEAHDYDGKLARAYAQAARS